MLPITLHNKIKKTLTLEAFEKNNQLKTVYIEVIADRSRSAFIAVKGTDLELFKNALELCRDKFIEGSNIARQNNVTEMRKSFGINFPSVNIVWSGS